MSRGAGRLALAVLAGLAAALLLGACVTGSGHAPVGRSAEGASRTAPGPVIDPTADPAAPVRRTAPTKVLLVLEENSTFSEVIGHHHAPYIVSLASRYASFGRATAGYALHCPSLASYILLTSGTTAGICDDADPAHHRLTQDNVFRQLSARGREWRVYADAMPQPCTLRNVGAYAVRHVPSTYYVRERAACRASTLPLGGVHSGELARRAAAGTLPAYTLVVPDDCHNMHGHASCRGQAHVPAADAWLRQRLAPVLAGPDFRSGRLVVIIAWDEGSERSNHVPLVVVHRDLHQARPTTDVTGCSVLRTTQEINRLPLLGCARTAPSLLTAVGLPHP